ncbi:MAG: hypothetical protein IH933_03405, partial [Euryarchaeota archaeon]|nr:hypothetical protein [Euryarchaeota archaeon]
MSDESTRRVDLWLRSSVPPEIRRAQLQLADRLHQCRAAGTIDDLAIQTWEQRVSVPATDREATDTWEAFDAFRTWASDNERELRPGFARHQRSSMTDADPVETITLPIMCLAVYDDQSLRTVAPCSDGTRVVTVQDCLGTLE